MLVRRAFRLASSLLLLGIIFVFAGCPAPPKPAPRITALEAPLPAPPGAQALETVPAGPVVEALPVFREPSVPVRPAGRLELPGGKLPVRSWMQACGFTGVRVISSATPPLVELTSPSGNLTLVLGQRLARWNGIHIGLGFPPMPEQGQVMVHSLDVAKNIHPLALGVLSVPKPGRVLVLDAGHGGGDPGSRTSGRAVLEKDLTLDWALRIERLLANSSWRVVLTRREDRDLSLLERVAIADAHGADLFISLHFNSLETNAQGKSQDEAGIETYCLTPAGAPSNVTRNFDDDPGRVYPNNEFDEQNLLLAFRLQSSLIAATGRRDRGVRRARFMTVVREQRRPAVLIEGGFLSNPAEAGLITQPEFRQKMAEAVRQALPP